MEGRTTASSAPEAVREQAIAWLARLRSEPTDIDRADFENWYVADPRHAETYEDVLNTWDETALAGRTPAARERHAGRRHSGVKVAGVAAAVLLLLVAGSFALTRYAWRGPVPETLLASRIGQIRTIVLDDGSRVTLDTDSVVHVAFDEDQRRLMLERGRARFEVAHDARRPFVVTAGTSEVVAHGTVFDIDLRQPRALAQQRAEIIIVSRPDHRAAEERRFRRRGDVEPGQIDAQARGAAAAPHRYPIRPAAVDQQHAAGTEHIRAAVNLVNLFAFEHELDRGRFAARHAHQGDGLADQAPFVMRGGIAGLHRLVDTFGHHEFGVIIKRLQHAGGGRQDILRVHVLLNAL